MDISMPKLNGIATLDQRAEWSSDRKTWTDSIVVLR